MDGINLEQLEEDFFKRLAEENKTKKQDEIRFQTMADPRITYDQYTELLKGVHLMPIRRCQEAEIKRYKQTVSYENYETPNT